jgi:carbon monoxide dehydrogenase subunit G
VAEAAYTTTTRLPQSVVWDFVQDMDNWGRFVTGYQRHEKHDEKRSTWTLKGDVGVLSRTLTFRVEIVEWEGPDRVAFTLVGVNEPMQGEGTFTMETVTGGAAGTSDAAAATAGAGGAGQPAGGGAPVAVAAPVRRGAFFRLLEAFWRFVLGLAGGGRPVREAAAAAPPAAGDTATRLTFQLRLVPGGPMAPMVDAMIRPLMGPAAEDLASRILAALEGAEGVR